MTQKQRRKARAYRKAWYARHRQAQSEVFHRQWEYNRAANAGMSVAAFRALPAVRLVCCGVWQAVTTLPHRCTTCGRCYLQPTPGDP
jgi:hypothetical protein